ncbi:MAG TPA: biopolymer transporter ExbD [Bacteroidales bacterium]|jgi:biopolymer transport protein ExbD|nr:biopolymer transporter ExbD [Bacteroidales bacterium]
MAEIIENDGGHKKGKRRAKKHGTHIDMTPMVDLACLLLTFFMLTTAFSKPKVMEIVLPSKDKVKDPPKIDDSRVVNVILAENDQIFFYNGLADPTKGVLPVLIKSNYGKDGIRKVLLQRNKDLFERVYFYHDSLTRGLGKYKANQPKDSIEKQVKRFRSSDKTGPIVLIKAAEGVKYGNFVNIMDEMAITNIARYTVVPLNYVEEKMLKDAIAGKNVEVQR